MLLMLPNTPAEEASNTCDWGNCDELTTSWRWSPLLAKWIPVCHEHRAKTPTNSDRLQERLKAKSPEEVLERGEFRCPAIHLRSVELVLHLG